MKNLKKQVKAIVALLLVAILVLSLASCGSSAPQAEDASGSHGALSWSYTKGDKTLRISGSGEMAGFENGDSVVWSAVRASAEKVIVTEGITSVGSYAFYGMTALTDVALPATLTSIGDYAFGYSSALKNVNLPAGVTSIGKGAFEACGALQSIYVPASVTAIGARAFAYCYSMQSAMITGLPARIESETFKNCKALDRLTFRTDLSAEIAQDAFVGAKLNYDTATKTDSVDGSSTITVHYVDASGAKMAEDTVETKGYGESYTYNSHDISGYTADVLTVTGTADGINKEITVTYTKNEVVETPAETPAPEAEEEADEPVGAGTIIAIVVMALVLIAIAVGAFLLIRSDKKTAGKNTTTVRKDQNAKKKGKK